MSAVLYNCKRCKAGLRVEYPIRPQGFSRTPMREENGRRIVSGVWIDSCGGGRPTIYGGDPLGVCKTCGKMMQYGALQATVRAEVKCDARCTGARGFTCDCSCGGKNHGAGWSQVGRPMNELLKEQS